MENILLVHRKTNKKKAGKSVQFQTTPVSEIAADFPVELQDAAIWKTCLRKILFCREDELSKIQPHLDDSDEILRGEQALTLLLEILCGLHSPIVGETEVYGQFKAFVESRKQLQDSLFMENRKWITFINTEVKQVRSNHLLGLGSNSYGSLIRRHTKELESASICGSGQLAIEILPWIAQKKSVQMVCRSPEKLKDFKEKYKNLKVLTYNDPQHHSQAVIIAAPLDDTDILKVLSQMPLPPSVIYDLRGEKNSLSILLQVQFPQVEVMSLEKFFSEIEETKKDTESKLKTLKKYLLEKALTFIYRTELRPLGWEDICA
jgi:glutamyl-tRNA reductase